MFIGTPAFLDGAFRRSGSSATYTAGLVSAAANTYPIVALGRQSASGSRFRGGLLTPIIGGADNAAISFGLWAVQRLAASAGASPADQLDFIRLGTGTATASTMQGGAQGGVDLPIGASDRVADGVTFTADGASTRGGALLAALTSADITAVNPTDNTPAGLIVPDFGGLYGFAVEIWSASADITGRMLVSLWA